MLSKAILFVWWLVCAVFSLILAFPMTIAVVVTLLIDDRAFYYVQSEWQRALDVIWLWKYGNID